MKMCDECGINPASIHLTQIINDETSISHLCESCAQKKGISISLVEEFENLQEEPQDEKIACPHCRMSLSDFKEKGLLGCAHCYFAFEKEIDELLIQMHGADEHKGKEYHGKEYVALEAEDIKQLRHELDIAVRNEKFELAAELRDKILSLTSEIKNGVDR
ncbi:MAG: UvrB/UvrC motif-containing protein [Fibrobacterota bacterium]